MTAAHLLFAILTTAYILVAIQLEERDLVQQLSSYSDYKRRVPSLTPRLPALRRATTAVQGTNPTQG
jgi:protein-S-isoprenylcysteine O-methyltransferase Ste14